MRPVSAGKPAAMAANPAHSSAMIARDKRVSRLAIKETARTPIMLALSNRSDVSELHLWWCLRIIVRCELRHWLVRSKEGGSPQYAGEGLECCVVDPHCFYVVAPSNRDAVLSSLELRLQRQEVLVGLEIGIVLADCKQPAERTGQLVLGILELLQFLRISELRDVDFHLGRLRSRLDHGGQDILLLLGVALHRGDQIGDEVRAALVVVLHVRPFRLCLLLYGGNC